jgi:hypothetical protein
MTLNRKNRSQKPTMPVTRNRTPRLGRMFRTACLVLALAGILLAGAGLPAVSMADTALAATSQACLRRCLTNCAAKDKGGGQTCLRACLVECPVHCGTVDQDCALDCLQRAPAFTEKDISEPSNEPWEATSRRSPVAVLVGRCAEACVVKPDCRPSAYDSGPAEIKTTGPHSR